MYTEHRLTGATLFSGGEGVGCGMRAAGISHAWGIEYNDKIASVARMNGFNVTTADVTQANPADFEHVDILHASPPCPNFSTAKTNSEESANDVALAEAVCRFIEHIEPRIFTLENVRGYDGSNSMNIILGCLSRCGYAFNWWVLNAADYGVPQTRRRLVLIALKTRVNIQRPQPTHRRPTKNQMSFSALHDWVGWHEVICDVLETMEIAHLMPWHMSRIDGVEIPETAMISGQASSGGQSLTVLNGSQPSMTITASNATPSIRIIANKKTMKPNPPALLLLQSFNASYMLPGHERLARRIIGNAVPPLLYQRVIESAIKALYNVY